jgi:stage V sporulation protein G
VKISEIRVKLTGDARNKLLAFCSVTFEGDFVVRDLKIIDGAKGPFIAMPSRKLADKCPRCGGKNHLRSKFCNECGVRLDPDRAPRDARGRARLHADLAHPIHAAARIELHKAVVKAFHDELERSMRDGYVPPSFDDFDQWEDSDDDYIDELVRRQRDREAAQRRRPREVNADPPGERTFEAGGE